MGWGGGIIAACIANTTGKIPSQKRPVASKVLTPGRVGRERLEKVVDSKKMTPATERDADESKDS
jgi:hypothetical protein